MRFLYTFAYEKQEKAAVLSKTAAFAEILKFRPTRPGRAEALKYRAIYKAFALTGRLADCYYTQGVALGYELLGLQPVLRPQAYLAVL